MRLCRGVLCYQSQPCNHRKWHAGVPSLLRRLAVILNCRDGKIEARRILASSRITLANSNSRSGTQWDWKFYCKWVCISLLDNFSSSQQQRSTTESKIFTTCGEIQKRFTTTCSTSRWPGRKRTFTDKNNSMKICHLVWKSSPQEMNRIAKTNW